MNRFRLVSVLILTLMMAVIVLAPASAQDEAPAVLILPTDRAQFLPGAFFDVRVEVHAEAFPEDFAVTINGEDASTVTGIEPTEESWTFGSDETPSQSLLWRDVNINEPGEYVVEVMAGGETTSVTWTVREPAGERQAQNVILFVADGGSQAVYTAARLVSRGMTEGTYDGLLSFDTFEEIGMISSSGLDSIITDSANSASAYNTGHKSAVNATGVYPDTSSDAFDDPQVETFASMIKRTLGMSVGIVTNSEFVDATPAAVWAHSRQRTNTTRAAYALELLDLEPEVILGGGARYMIPASAEGSARSDEEDVFTLYEEAGYTLTFDSDELAAAVENGVERLAGFYHPGNMNVWLDRNVYTDNVADFPNQPGLDEMTLAALEVLSQNENGFYLMVEASSVDKQLHPNDFDRAIADMIELDVTIMQTMEWLEANGRLENTLIIVTSDHAHSFDVYGTVNVEAFNAAEDDNARRNAIGIYQGAGFPTYADEDGDYFPDSWVTDIVLAWGKVENPPFTEDFQVSPVPRSPSIISEGVAVDNPEDDPNGLPLGGNLPAGATSSVHTLQDVPVYAQGPNSEHLGRFVSNIEVFFAMADALGLDPRNAE